MKQNWMLSLLKQKLSPALGCTEPAALAYAGALAGKYVQGRILQVQVRVDKNLYKNCLRVTIPGTGLKGLDYAVALGITGGKPEYKLEALCDLSDAAISNAEEMVSNGMVKLKIQAETGLYISVLVESENDSVHCIIEGSHSEVTLLEHNGQKLKLPDLDQETVVDYNKGFSIDEIVEFSRSIPAEALDFLAEARKLNHDLALIGLGDQDKNFVGPALNSWTKDDLGFDHLSGYARSLAAAGCDARMSGRRKTVMALAGSGNQGITAIVPVYAVVEALGLDREVGLRALALSCLVTLYIKSKLGLLTPVCGCAIAAGAGVSAAITYIYGGDDSQVKAAVTNLVGGLAGMICDGAKGSCAFKIAIAVGAAFDSAKLALNNKRILPGDGIVGSTIEGTVDNLVIITREGMQDLDDTLVRVLGGRIYLPENF